MSHAPRSPLVRIMRDAVLAAAITTGAAATASAQAGAADTSAAPPSRWEFVMASGTLVPTGAQRGIVARGAHSSAQLTYLATPTLAASATLGWARSRDRRTDNGAKLDVFMYDVGAEFRAPRAAAPAALTVMPFLGLGVGARTYDSRAAGVPSASHAAGYISAGGELTRARLRVRLDVRDYLSGAASAGDRALRNDIVVMVGLRLVRP